MTNTQILPANVTNITLEELLKRPDEKSARQMLVWKVVVSGNILWNLLRTAVQAHQNEAWWEARKSDIAAFDEDIADETLLRKMNNTYPEKHSDTPDIKAKQQKAKDMIFCARFAALQPEQFQPSQGQVDEKQLFMRLGIKPDDAPADNSWTWACARALLGEEAGQTLNQRSVAVPIAYTSPDKDCGERQARAGGLATLEVAVIRPGNGNIRPHPAGDFLLTWPKNSFLQSMNASFALACSREEKEVLVDALWRVEIDEEIAAQGLNGWSASGAAYRGFYYAYHQIYPDPEVLVLAALDEKNQTLTSVDKLSLKLDAVLEKNRQAKANGSVLPEIDTVVIYFNENAPSISEDPMEQPTHIEAKIEEVKRAGLAVVNLAVPTTHLSSLVS